MRKATVFATFLAAMVALRAPATASGGAACRREPQTPSQVEACISVDSLWRHLTAFQDIANANRDVHGHPTRDTGTRGYEASVGYVAGLMRRAGYLVTIQPYRFSADFPRGTPVFDTPSGEFAPERDWYVAQGSGGGDVTAVVLPPSASSDGCDASDFAGFAAGAIALLARGACAMDMQVANAELAGARAVVIYAAEEAAYPGRLTANPGVPVIGVATASVGAALLARWRQGTPAIAHIAVQLQRRSGVDYNVIADSPYGDVNRVLVIDAHLDSIYGAGMLDNASGSTSILETALVMAKTPTRNHVRYIWFGGEEIGLLGSHYYTTHLSPAERKRLVFDVDVDVTATPNFDIQIADPAKAYNRNAFPPNVIPGSRIGNDAFEDYFATEGVVARPAPFGNDGTDSNSFSLAGVPNSGILTEQDCCKGPGEVRIWGGFRGNYEGKVPGFNGGCVDIPHRWCDNLSNNDPFVFDLVSRAVAHITAQLANDAL